jgi:putative NADH-flavin reductase
VRNLKVKIVLLGATGKTGREVLKQALEAGHLVTALIRSPNNLPAKHENLHIVIGDATDKEAIESAMKGNDVLVSTIGSTNTSLITKSTEAILRASLNEPIERIIMLSSFAARRAQLKLAAKILTSLLMKGVVQDKQNGEKLLRRGHTGWTIVYAARLTDETKGKRKVRVLPLEEKVGLKNAIARKDVAAWILQELDTKSYINKDVLISQ